MGLRQIGAHLQGHPDMNRTPGVEVSTGSLGQGLSMCVGICLGLRLDGLDETAHVFGVLSDGDCQEGQTWEAATAAPHFGVTNLTAIVDYNHLQTDGTTEEVMDTADVRAKFEAFGWDAVEIDGHDMSADRRGARAQPHASGARRRSSARPRRARASRRWRAASGSTASRRTPSSPPRPWRSSSSGSSGRRRTCRAGSEDRADRDPPRIRRRAGRARRATRGRRRARRRPRRLDPVDEVRQALPRPLLQLRRRRGEHDVDGVRPGGDRQGPVRLDLRDLRHRPRL